MQESSSSHSIPHVALTSDSKAPSISYSASHTTDMNSAPSTNTPQFKKKLISDKSLSPSAGREGSGQIAKHQSFDYAKSTLYLTSCLCVPIYCVQFLYEFMNEHLLFHPCP